ncbi:pentapeptide repeat-containing protein [Bathymodiolus thermophilus thioautotrophic gill symbiont]|uniref:pentapeptide repeat-containing protein n=1 Tax=Bathymodiolus thermophilus thioautotrophic gill symbiont TaxID=2360 RepID=UPI001F14F3A4|nr:pentapeptide repeat-containing protein [Bathymodiolus thermophilus thioautotrophic gill symbiont]
MENVNWKYSFDEGYFKNFRTNFGKESYWLHQNTIAALRRKNNNHKRSENTKIRAFVVVVTTIFVAFFNSLYVPLFVANSDSIFIKITSVGVSGVVMSAPIIFVIWFFRDKNRLMELANARKDTNLKEFQQLQRWATGNIDGDNEDNRVALQISALHSLRAYLKGEYGESFRRGAYEIFRAILATQHQKALQQLGGNVPKILQQSKKPKSIMEAIDSCQLTKQLNIIASEEWFNLLIDHNFSTRDISLMGVDLSFTYLRHRTYGKTLDLYGAQLQKASLSKAQLQGAYLLKAQLQGAYLLNAQLQGANLLGVQLQGANLSHAQLQGVDLSHAQLQGAYLLNAQLQGAGLQSAQLVGADLSNAQLQGADLQGAQLQGVNLLNAQLQGVYLRKTCDQYSFEQRIKQQIDKETDSQNLKKQYRALSNEQKSNFIVVLKAVSEDWHTNAISRIENASGTLDLSEAITGKYSQKEAGKWLNDYKKVKKQ